MAINHGTPFVAVLTTNGDQTGTFSAIGDYSAAPVDFYYQPEPEHTLHIHTLEIVVRDELVTVEHLYGNGPALIEGFYAFLDRPGEEIWRFPSEARIRRNWDWGSMIKRIDFGVDEKSRQTLVATVNFKEICGVDIPVSGKDGWKFGVRLNDDFTALIHQQFVVFGSLGN
jgi:hypothetical protein